MLFNSFEFAIFLPLVFCVYWILQGHSIRLQNAILLVASYVFYGWWDYRFLSLIFASSLVDYLVGLSLDREDRPRSRNLLLGISLAANLGVLGAFKYYDFFISSLAASLDAVGIQANLPTLRVVLPVGISFYTFQTLSYTIDVYRRQLTHTRDPLAFFTFVSFFPQLVAGPIERAKNLLPQFLERRTFDGNLAKDGLRQILWGLFKKTVIADRVAVHVNAIFSGEAEFGPATHWIGAFLFAIQIYGDFSGYSDIALGTARLFGFELKRNFAYPYFSRDIAEFWRRWHISLSSWFRDYVFIPIGGSRGGNVRRLRNVLVVFTVSGLWHGANWTYVIWGLLNGLYYIPLMLLGNQKTNTGEIAPGRFLPPLRVARQIATTFTLTLVAWVFFRAESVAHAIGYLSRMLNPFQLGQEERVPAFTLALCLLFLLWEWSQRHRAHGLDIGHRSWALRWAAYYTLTLSIVFLGSLNHVPFIYFQF